VNRRQPEDKLARFSNRLVQIKFIVFEIAMLIGFIAAVLALVRHESDSDPRLQPFPTFPQTAFL
jgi:hypothetical protein